MSLGENSQAEELAQWVSPPVVDDSEAEHHSLSIFIYTVHTICCMECLMFMPDQAHSLIHTSSLQCLQYTC